MTDFGKELILANLLAQQFSIPLSVIVGKVDGLRFQIRQDGLDRGSQLTGLRRRVAGFNRYVDLEQESHQSPRFWIG